MPKQKSDLETFIRQSRDIGKNFELVQGAGGNTSVKLDKGIMVIKSSGSLLKNMSSKHGYVMVNRSTLEPFLDEAAKLPNPVASENYLHSSLSKAVVGKTNEKPSMEAVMHLFLPRHVVHTHAIYANVFNCMVEGPAILASIFGKDIDIVPYATPGFELALKIRELTKKQKNNYTIFLLNHGVILADRSARAYSRMFEVNDVCRDYILKKLPDWPQFDKAGRMIADYLNKYSTAREIAAKCCFPDAVVFYSRQLRVTPILEAMIYIVATVEALGGTLKPLDKQQQATLLALDSEKYRIGKKL